MRGVRWFAAGRRLFGVYDGEKFFGTGAFACVSSFWAVELQGGF